jgi:hypothetical protein
MAFIHLPQRWNRQPQIPVGIDATSPFATGLVRAFLPPYSFDLARHSTVELGSEITVGVDNGYQSFIQTSATGSTGITFKEFAISSGASLLLFQRRFSTNSNGWMYVNTNTLKDHFCYNDYVYSSVFSNTRWIDSVDPVGNYQLPHTFACSVTPSSQISTLNGKLFVQNSLSVSLGISANPRLLIAGSGYSYNGALYVALMWNRALSFNELVSISQNPWQVFAPLNRVIYFPVSSNNAWTLIVADAFHNHSLEQATLTQANLISLNNAAHSQTSDTGVALTSDSLITPANAAQSQSVDPLALIQAHLLTVSAALHDHNATQANVGQSTALTVDDTAHSNTANSLELTQIIVLSVLNTLHEQSSELLALSAQITLIINDALHAQFATAAIKSSVTPAGRVFIVAGENRLFLVAASSRNF